MVERNLHLIKSFIKEKFIAATSYGDWEVMLTRKTYFKRLTKAKMTSTCENLLLECILET